MNHFSIPPFSFAVPDGFPLAFLGNIGGSELLLILLLVLLVFGPKQLPEVAKTLGKTLKGVRKATEELRHEVGMDDAINQTRRLGNDLARSVQASIDPKPLPPPKPEAGPAGALPGVDTAAAPEESVERRSPKPRPGAQPPAATLTDSAPSEREPS